MATAISDSLWLQGAYGSIYNQFDDSYLHGNASIPTILYGSLIQTDVCINVKWRWLAFPAILLVLTSGLLLGTVIQGLITKQRVPTWKLSVLPFLYAMRGIGITATDTNLTAMEADAAKRRIQLVNDGERWEFMQD